MSLERLERLWPAAVVALALNSLYLAARVDATLFYFANVVLHLMLGIAVAAGAWRVGRRHWQTLPTALRAVAATFAGAAACGCALAVTGAARAWLPLLWAHLILTALTALQLLVYALRRPMPARALAAIACTLAIAAPFARRASDTHPPQHRIVNPRLAPETMDGEGAGPTSPFFPSSAETDVGHIIPANFFMTSESCGRCHPDIYQQWKSSVHHFSSFNNQWYRKSIEYMQDVVGTRPSKWCAGCHDHAVFFNGRFDRPIREQIDTPEAQNGLGCLSCHSIVHVKSSMGQGDFTIEYPPLHDLAASEDPWLSAAHDYLLKLDPGPHKRTFLKSFHREQTAEFCSSCHKVHLDVPVNSYRWFRGFNDYDNWQASAVSGQGARSFYYPPKPQRCADCHMPLVASNDPAAKEGKIRSHRFPAANTALPFVNHDAEQLKITQDFLRDGQVSIDIFGLVRTPAAESASVSAPQAATEPRIASTFAIGEEAMASGGATVSGPAAEVLAPLGKVDAAMRRGESARIEVVVRTRKVGHFFPGGTVDAFDVWVELEAVDSHGRTILHSGALENGNGPVDPGAHRYRSLMLDEHGNPINKRNAYASRSVAYVRLIPPGAADTVHYRLQIPPDCGDTVTLKARVNYRKFAWWNTQWSFAGVRDPQQKDFAKAPGYDDGRWVFTGDTSGVSGQIKAIPEIPVTVMAQAETTLRILPKGAPLPAVASLLDKSVRERWNDYGIGLLLQGDLRSAEQAFLRVTEMDPGYADGWVNVGRCRVQQGNMAAAETILGKALEVDPHLAKTHFFLGLTAKTAGRYDEALLHLREAAAQYPRDRVVANQIARVLFLQRHYPEAVDEREKVFAVDPEDVQAHYNAMLCYQGMGASAMAKQHETLYLRFKADESAQAITGPYRQLHPDDNNERQSVHEHGVRTPEVKPAPVYPARAVALRNVAASAGGSR